MSSPALASRTVDIRTLEGCVNRKACVLETFDALDQLHGHVQTGQEGRET